MNLNLVLIIKIGSLIMRKSYPPSKLPVRVNTAKCSWEEKEALEAINGNVLVDLNLELWSFNLNYIQHEEM